MIFIKSLLLNPEHLFYLCLIDIQHTQTNIYCVYTDYQLHSYQLWGIIRVI